MKKKILFIVSNLESGGVSKSMVSLLNALDYERYDVDLYIITPVGLFMDQIPPQVHVISHEQTATFLSAFPSNLLLMMKKGWFQLAFQRFLAAIVMKWDKGKGAIMLSKNIAPLVGKYDLAVDYNGQQQLYYLVDQVNANKKVTFFHSDYKKWPFYYSADKIYFKKVDHIFTISQQCVHSLKKYFSDIKNKIGLFENISSPTLIHQLAEEKVSEDFPKNTFVTLGHLSETKGTEMALQAAKILKDKGVKFKWYFIGADSKEQNYQKLADQLGVADYISFLGTRQNPYPYIKRCDVIVHPSRFEGRSIALDEAKILCKPIVVTNFSTVNDQFQDTHNASICEMSAEDLALHIEELLQNHDLANYYTENLKREMKDNTSEVEKLYQLLT